ncbi:hypothetical protein [Kitasatospora sp. NBC_01539]|uniref:hypothetical protein n=1 Tax=unclassified Kitasatospora TaxID=2633591 RepID=UPI0034DC0F6D
MPPSTAEVAVPLFIDVRVDLATGDVVAPSAGSRERLLLAGLGPLRSAVPDGPAGLLLETADGARWRLRISEASGLVESLDVVR